MRAAVGLPIVLVGPMGAGKTRVGSRVAAMLDVPFVDTDARIVERYGPIDVIFATAGEPQFREFEREVVAAALRERAVVALGGGAVLDIDTRIELAERSVVWLHVDAADVATRLSGGNRPLLTEGGIDTWREIAEQRHPLYTSVASVQVDTTRRSVAGVVNDITEWFGGRS